MAEVDRSAVLMVGARMRIRPGRGEAGDSSIGYWVTNNADKFRIRDCSSEGHETAGYQVDSGCTHGMILGCSSGGGDGRWTDPDDAAVFSDFTYDDNKFKRIIAH